MDALIQGDDAMEFLVTIRDKIANYSGKMPYVCGNGDCTIIFDFDIAWDGIGLKTARFVKDDGTYQEQVFTGNECPMPVIAGTHGIRVGVYAGNLHTTTPAYIPAKKSILCASGLPADPAPDVYAQLMERINELAKGGASEADIATAIEKYMQEHPVQMEESDPSVHAWAKQPQKPTYTAEEVGAQPKGDYALQSEIPAPYTLPVASADTLGGVKVGKGLQMNGETIEVAEEGGFELIESIYIGSEADKPAGITTAIDGDVGQILRTNIRYDALRVTMLATPSGGSNRNAFVSVSFDNGTGVVVGATYIHATNKYSSRYEVYKNMGIWDGQSFGQVLGWGGGAVMGLGNPSELVSATKGAYICAVSLYVNAVDSNTYPVGTIIKIYGVKHNA